MIRQRSDEERVVILSVSAGYEALEDAGLSIPLVDGDRAGVVLGTAIGGGDEAAKGVKVINEEGYKKLSPSVLAASLPNILAHYLSYYVGPTGYISTISTACASGAPAIGEAAEVIRRGGFKAMICPALLPAFFAMRASSLYNGDPATACRPFDVTRDGLVLGEGCAVYVLERLTHARARGARIYAEILGQASSSDAYHVAQPDPDGKGAARVMTWALQDAGLRPGLRTQCRPPARGAVLNQEFVRFRRPERVPGLRRLQLIPSLPTVERVTPDARITSPHILSMTLEKRSSE